MNNTETLFITVPLEKEAHLWARGFAAEQANPHKGKQVYLNTLAVYAVQSFLKWLQIETDLEDGDSWHPIVRSLFDVADLVIPNLGKLECRPVLIGENVLTLPSEVMEDRIAYIAVGFQEQLNEVQLLGFAPALDPGNVLTQLAIADLQPLENLTDYLYRLELANEYLQSNDEVAIQARERLTEQSLSEIVAQLERIYRTCEKDEWRFIAGNLLAGNTTTGGGVSKKNTASVVDREGLDEEQQIEFQDLAEELLEKLGEIWEGELVFVSGQQSDRPPVVPVQDDSTSLSDNVEYLRQWLEGIFRQDWQPKEAALISYRRGQKQSQDVSRVKLIELNGHVVALLVSVLLEVEDEFSIHLRLYPASRAIYLPQGVELIALDESGETLSEVQAEEADNWIQIELEGGEPGDRFSVKVALGDISITEHFKI